MLFKLTSFSTFNLRLISPLLKTGKIDTRLPICFQILGGTPFFQEQLSVAVSAYTCMIVTPKKIT